MNANAPFTRAQRLRLLATLHPYLSRDDISKLTRTPPAVVREALRPLSRRRPAR